MKILNISNISSSNAMPIKSGTLQFLQDAHKEAIAGLVTNLIPTPDPNTIYILSGCKNSTVAPIHTLSAGVLYYNGEIFNFDGATFTLTGLQKAYARIETTQYLTNADPVQFTDGVNRNVHNIRKIVIENTILSSGLPEFKDFVTIQNNSLKGDTKEVVCDSTYLSTYFDGAGLGRLERTGWAIMNGATHVYNGVSVTVPNDNGKVVIAYGSSYSTLGATGGSENAVLIAHNHDTIEYSDGKRAVNTLGTGSSELGKAIPESAGIANVDKTSTKGQSSAGVDSPTENGIGKNMQPYVVRLRIMKL